MYGVLVPEGTSPERHQVIGQLLAQLVKLPTFHHLGEVDTGHHGTERTS
jgi:hypothetical protein